jgi:hypothetical protein
MGRSLAFSEQTAGARTPHGRLVHLTQFAVIETSAAPKWSMVDLLILQLATVKHRVR